MTVAMAGKGRLRKVVDETSRVHCASGFGLIREEVWLDAEGEVARYNLAFINHFLTGKDNGRVLGYDNSHGQHHRHFMGTSEPFKYVRYDDLVTHFLAEVRELRKDQS
jgi:Family of unknown function (DUF6516)